MSELYIIQAKVYNDKADVTVKNNTTNAVSTVTIDNGSNTVENAINQMNPALGISNINNDLFANVNYDKNRPFDAFTSGKNLNANLVGPPSYPPPPPPMSNVTPNNLPAPAGAASGLNTSSTATQQPNTLMSSLSSYLPWTSKGGRTRNRNIKTKSNRKNRRKSKKLYRF
uniref:Uncharacterized protein n=1 Tax=viral metagenome TaxID=1070528 RepID=A0A6C0D361_9ZZZZ